ncbi:MULTISPECIES: L-serine ammonia-lyase, iron-sulfur-dependent, subunit alpha [Lachnospiraceae]|jgi:L-serine dehydratase|uniref:L-serine ammonia-lyase n=1 Tax=Faecalicatena acetigenes TaxID=2981790 RepID=A0ABT2TD64_9FIRM|nr:MULTISPECIES: L-serine ammonia-lyase, iron-sulfur-dependent, subunit alpha [Lachnospiraceae]MCU6748225.1 L-serine ammonia-lyase, iron-sulfur-dependent, subunit alpha [Faecalicatena acetigenes]RGT73052.1 L-serine ammonia-lyase, iron-sulfur-dependent, subunit alpha [Ruminococcus sp. AF18-22]SCI32526.1 L-serine dehydratase%2C alpha chain [uncultured Clostridium sp.]
MKRQNPSIFNDIVGPTMVGPSSSHTCGPSRIGYLAQQLLPGKLKKATIAFAKDGAYTQMYKGQRSDMGYVNGLLGRRPEDPRLRRAFKEAEEAGVEIQFVIEDFAPVVPNISHLTLENTEGRKVVVFSDSTGGGTVKLLEIDGFEVAIVGDCYELIIRTDSAEKENEEIKNKVCAMFPSNEGVSVSTVNGQGMINIKQKCKYEETVLETIRSIEHVTEVMEVEPVLVVPSNRTAELPFVSAEEMLKAAQTEGKELWELAIDYEMSRAGWTYDQVWEYMEYVVETMEHSSKEALKGDIDMAGIIEPTSGKVEQYIKTDPKALDMGVLNTAVPWGTATMEYSSAMGVVLCAPTGGSAGVFPGAILGVANHLGLTKEEKIRAMFVTSIIGIVMSKDCNYSAELYGCQVEPGAASGMAAGGLVYLMGGSALQSCMAASCAVQNILGTICDPLAGLVQVPCINRNAIAIANAVVSANMIMGGFDPLIPLDQTAETLFRVGRQLPSELRCTCNGGLCTTPCGQKLAREQEERDNRR